MANGTLKSNLCIQRLDQTGSYDFIVNLQVDKWICGLLIANINGQGNLCCVVAVEVDFNNVKLTSIYGNTAWITITSQTAQSIKITPANNRSFKSALFVCPVMGGVNDSSPLTVLSGAPHEWKDTINFKFNASANQFTRGSTSTNSSIKYRKSFRQCGYNTVHRSIYKYINFNSYRNTQYKECSIPLGERFHIYCDRCIGTFTEPGNTIVVQSRGKRSSNCKSVKIPFDSTITTTLRKEVAA